MGSTVALTDVSGNIQSTYTYGPFGQTAVAGAGNDNPYQFHGREAEPMNGLFAGMYYFRAGYLDTGLSRSGEAVPPEFAEPAASADALATASAKAIVPRAPAPPAP